MKAKEGLALAYGSKKGLGRANRDWGEENYPLNGGSFENIQIYQRLDSESLFGLSRVSLE